ncbi:MAG: 1-acyl-sn-glycerol-3-phosphate acyltransferase [Chlamydiia bacterium]|nr:1-acyl-sn-glycerol-3-phosphate acyltransferase [Chlamydiia bacterium]
MDFLNYLQTVFDDKKIPENVFLMFMMLYESVRETFVATGESIEKHHPVFVTFVEKVIEQVKHPYQFEPYHEKITKPFDYYQFGIDFFLPLIEEETSCINNVDVIYRMKDQLAKGENVILFANHQTEVDPQLMSISLEKICSKLASEMIFVAGDRVINDPLAIPFSMGRNLLCIYSKRYIDNPPEKKHEKQLHNQRVMRRMSQLLADGGKCIYVAPSGGRDRPGQEGEVEVASFDPNSIEMFRLMAIQGKRGAHFYPLALDTYNILPPPDVINWELGERRIAHRDGIRLSFGNEIDMDHFPGAETAHNRHAKRKVRADYIWGLVKRDYEKIKRKKS